MASPYFSLLGRPRTDEETYMTKITKNDVSPYAGITVMLTVEGRLALAAYALAAADKTRSAKQRKRLCGQALNHLQAIVQG
jgi:hypothetical protein